MQRGVIIKHRASWTLLFYDKQVRNGKIKRVRVSKKLAAVSKDFPTKASVRSLADKILAPLNQRQLQPESSALLTDFIEKTYFPMMDTELRPSTLTNYKQSIYFPHLKSRLETLGLRLRDFRTVHGQRLLRDIPEVGHTTLLHHKNFLSGVFRFARREGVIDHPNPMVDVTVPGRPKKFTGKAYTLAEAMRIVEDITRWADQQGPKYKQISQTACDVIAMLSLTGLRQSEIRGLRWSDWNEADKVLTVQRSVWRTKEGPTKNPESEGTIPVLPLLCDLLETRRERLRPNPGDYIFAGTRRKTVSLNFHNLEKRIIQPAIEFGVLNGKPDVQWSGYHGFRRGLASNLFGLGVNPKVIQAILRHSDVATTLKFYVQTPDSESRAALEKMDAAIKAMPSATISAKSNSGSK